MEENNSQQPLREISDEELNQVLEAHKLWLLPGDKEGVRADLSYVNLAQRDLNGINLTDAILQGCQLEGAKLAGANLTKALCAGANFGGALMHLAFLANASLLASDLRGAHLFRADLSSAILSNAKIQDAKCNNANFSNADLNSADVDGAIFDKANLQNANLDNIKNLNKASLHNVNMEGATGLKGTEFARADITGARLPEGIRDFSALETVEETSRNARKIFFATLLACVYCWLTIGTTTDVKLITNTASSPLPIIGTAIPIAWFYKVAPVMLACLYFYLHFYLQRLWQSMAGLPAIFEDGRPLDERAYPWILNGLVRRHFEILRKRRSLLNQFEEIVSIVLAWWVVPITLLWFWLRYIPRHDWIGTNLQIALITISIAAGLFFYNAHASVLRGKKPLPFTLKKCWRDKRIFKCLGVIISLSLLIILSYGSINGTREFEDIGAISKISLVPRIFSWIGYDVFANIVEKDVSLKPENYWMIDSLSRENAITGARLAYADLRYASARSAFMANADMRYADIRGAHFISTDLQGADLTGTNLKDANLTWANLKGADLTLASLQGTNLFNANLQDADLTHANLQGALLTSARLQGAFLVRANLQGADITTANLQGADFQWARLQGADLTYSGNLTQKKLDVACGDSLTKLPDGLTIPLCDTCAWYRVIYGFEDTL
ncbi:MAG: hypothetical protein CVT49_09630 [candidate division Zixibacteria bacterium HGW-Zixibacteria-1]|nr:MAG: hypothetical protein CVT49_09630 [candidate division Zixibacteria bacterium HGW-Zixibacteria-1]